MESKSDAQYNQPAICHAEASLCNYELALPIIEMRLREPISLVSDGGAVLTLLPGATIYVSAAEFGYVFVRALQGLAAQAQAEEEERWQRATPEQVQQM